MPCKKTYLYKAFKMSTIRHSRRLAAKPRVDYSELEEEEIVHMMPTARRSHRLVATPTINYTEMDDDDEAPVPAVGLAAPAVGLAAPAPAIGLAAPAPAPAPAVRITEAAEKKRHVNHMRELLAKCDNSKGKSEKAALAIEIMQYILTCVAFCNAHPRFRDAIVAKCYEFKKYEGDMPELVSACDAVLCVFGKPLEVPVVLPVLLPSGSCGDCHGCENEEEKLRAIMEARHAKKAVPVPVPAPAPAPVDAAFLREHLRRIQGEMEDAETEGYFHSLVTDYLTYVRKPEVLAALKASPSDRMIARGIIRQYENDLCCYHEEDMVDFLYLCPV